MQVGNGEFGNLRHPSREGQKDEDGGIGQEKGGGGKGKEGLARKGNRKREVKGQRNAEGDVEVDIAEIEGKIARGWADRKK